LLDEQVMACATSEHVIVICPDAVRPNVPRGARVKYGVAAMLAALDAGDQPVFVAAV